MKKRLIAFFVLIAFLALPAFAALASDGAGDTMTIGALEEVQPLSSGTRIEDNADLLTVEQEAELAEKLDRISRKHDCDVVVITALSPGNKDARVYGADAYEQYGYNMSGGMYILFCKQTRDYAYSATGKCEAAFTEPAREHLKETVVMAHLSNDEYYQAFNVFAEKCDEFMTNIEKGKQPYKKNLISTTFAAIGSAVVGLISGGGAAGSMAAKLKSVHHKTNASDYVKKDSLNIVNRSEYFLYSNVTKTEIPRDTNTRSGGGGSSGSFSSSSGASWTGSSGKC